MQIYHPLSIAHRQELANSLSHGFGMLFGIVAIPVLMAVAASAGNIAGLIGVGIYGFSFLLVFTASTLYHSVQQPNVKRVLNIIDHISIYFLIAGTYTPFILVGMLDKTGIIMLSVLWAITIVGAFFKVFFTGRFNVVSTLLYLAMGWALLVVAEPFFAAMSTSAIVLLAVGGGLYSLGVIFYLWERLTYHHAIWHFFVLSASICHYVAVLLTIM
jgi:hemolysin III